MRVCCAVSVLVSVWLAGSPAGLACEGACCDIPKAKLRVLGALEAGYLLSLEVPSCAEETDCVRRIHQKDWVALLCGGDEPALLAVEAPAVGYLTAFEALYYWSRPKAHRKLLTTEEIESRWRLPEGREAHSLKVARSRWPTVRYLKDPAFPSTLHVEAIYASDGLGFQIAVARKTLEWGCDDRGPFPYLLPIAKRSALSLSIIDGIGSKERKRSAPVCEKVTRTLSKAGFAKVRRRRSKKPHPTTRVFVRIPKLRGGDLVGFVPMDFWFDAALARIDEAVVGRVLQTNAPASDSRVQVGELTWNEGSDVVVVLGDDLVSLARRRAAP
ncbi:MAG: hypothetical protein JXR96_06710 [Deltaproteobacteria bacterium]|nr:hypothetical protein [Deltaproteobacteria bacterium]